MKKNRYISNIFKEKLGEEPGEEIYFSLKGSNVFQSTFRKINSQYFHSGWYGCMFKNSKIEIIGSKNWIYVFVTCKY